MNKNLIVISKRAKRADYTYGIQHGSVQTYIGKYEIKRCAISRYAKMDNNYCNLNLRYNKVKVQL